MKRMETVILSSLIHNEEYLRQVMPFLTVEYFQNASDAKLFTFVKGFTDKYGKPPTLDALRIAISKDKTLREEEEREIVEVVDDLEPNQNDLDWLIDETEQFCKDKAVYNAILTSIEIIDGKNKKLKTDGIPGLLEDALAVAFDNTIGHDYVDDAEERYDSYHNEEEKIPFDIEMLNRVTKGGLPKKTLTVYMAGVGVGKSLIMCHNAAGALAQGKNVLYITLEMAEEEIAKRIDANLLDVTMDELMYITKPLYMKRMEKFTKRSRGKLFIKEYPTSGAHAGHFDALINELKIKKGFVPDIIFIDYLNICSSRRLREDSAQNTYTWVKAIAEEIRGLAVKHKVPIVSATQSTRSGSVSSDPSMTDTSESFGLPATVDVYFAVVQDEELDSLNQYLFKQLKNRLRDKALDRRFIIGVEKNKMRLYDVEKSAQKTLLEKPNEEITGSRAKFANKDFSDIKV